GSTATPPTGAGSSLRRRTTTASSPPPGNPGKNRLDLLTVLGHEIGHLLGRDHEADGVMAETRAAGTRAAPDGSTMGDQISATDWSSILWALDLPLAQRIT